MIQTRMMRIGRIFADFERDKKPKLKPHQKSQALCELAAHGGRLPSKLSERSEFFGGSVFASPKQVRDVLFHQWKKKNQTKKKPQIPSPTTKPKQKFPYFSPQTENHESNLSQHFADVGKMIELRTAKKKN